MKPNATFSYLKNNQVHHDLISLARYYQPILGYQGLSLYTYLLGFDDQGAKDHQFSEILNHLNLGMGEFEQTLNVLLALQLVKLYQVGEDYLIQMQSVLDGQAFFNHQVLTKLLEKKIGETAVHHLRAQLPEVARPITKDFSDVFSGLGEFQMPSQRSGQDDFDLVHFKQLMARDNLRFEDEQTDVIQLFNYASLAKKTWFETYQVAKTLAVGQVISPKRMLKSLQQTQPETIQFSEAEQTLIRWAKQRTALEFLADIKANRQASISQSERQVLKEIAQLGLLDPVINVLVLYTFNKVDSANLNEKYVRKLANDFSYQNINSAEAAVLSLREGRPAKTKSRQGVGTQVGSNVPEWSKEAYRTEATPEELEELEALRRRMLGDKET